MLTGHSSSLHLCCHQEGWWQQGQRGHKIHVQGKGLPALTPWYLLAESHKIENFRAKEGNHQLTKGAGCYLFCQGTPHVWGQQHLPQHPSELIRVQEPGPAVLQRPQTEFAQKMEKIKPKNSSLIWLSLNPKQKACKYHQLEKRWCANIADDWMLFVIKSRKQMECNQKNLDSERLSHFYANTSSSGLPGGSVKWSIYCNWSLW